MSAQLSPVVSLADRLSVISLIVRNSYIERLSSLTLSLRHISWLIICEVKYEKEARFMARFISFG